MPAHLKTSGAEIKKCLDNKVQIIQPVTGPPVGSWWLLDVLLSLRPSHTTGTKISRWRIQHITTTLCLDEGAWERSGHQCARLFSSMVQNRQQLLQSDAVGSYTQRCLCPQPGQSPPSHHVLVVAAVIRRVGVPAVLEVVGQDVVPVVLLL